MQSKTMNAVKLKRELWETLKSLRGGLISAGNADAVATSAREILRTVRVQLAILAAGKSVTAELTSFADPDKE